MVLGMREYRINEHQIAALFEKCGKTLTFEDGTPFYTGDLDRYSAVELDEIVHCGDCAWACGDILTCTFWSDRNTVMVDPMNFCAWGRLRES